METLHQIKIEPSSPGESPPAEEERRGHSNIFEQMGLCEGDSSSASGTPGSGWSVSRPQKGRRGGRVARAIRGGKRKYSRGSGYSTEDEERTQQSDGDSGSQRNLNETDEEVMYDDPPPDLAPDTAELQKDLRRMESKLDVLLEMMGAVQSHIGGSFTSVRTKGNGIGTLASYPEKGVIGEVKTMMPPPYSPDDMEPPPKLKKKRMPRPSATSSASSSAAASPRQDAGDNMEAVPTPENVAAITQALVSSYQESPGSGRNKRKGGYVHYTPEQRAMIGKYAAENGSFKASKHFTIPESTARTFMKIYRTRMTENPESEGPRSIELKQRGRPSLLGEYDEEVLSYLRSLSEAGADVNSEVVRATARRILIQKNKSVLAEFGGSITLGLKWAQSALVRLGLRGKNKGSKSSSQGQEATGSNSNETEQVLEEVFPTMIQDEITELAEQDDLIRGLGKYWLVPDIDTSQQNTDSAKYNMRRAAYVLKQAKEITGKPLSAFSDLIKPDYMDVIIEATVKATWDELEPILEEETDFRLTHTWISSFHLKIMADLKLQSTQNETKQREAREFSKELPTEIDWYARTLSVARKLRERQKQDNATMVPSGDDLCKLSEFLPGKLRTMELYVMDGALSVEYIDVVKFCQARILLYNKMTRRKLQEATLEEFSSRSVCIREEFPDRTLTTVEKLLLPKHEVFFIKGRAEDSGSVPVFIPQDCSKALLFLADPHVRQSAGVLDSNNKLFASTFISDITFVSGYESLKFACAQCGVERPDQIISNTFRTLQATITQVIGMPSTTAGSLHSHLAPLAKSLAMRYRVMDNQRKERVNMAKMCVIAEQGMGATFGGRDMIDVTVEEIVSANEPTVKSSTSEAE